jgi:hypothetical protein
MTLWRNGAFHIVHLPPEKRFKNGGMVTLQGGDASTPAKIEAQLPPIDHAMDNVHPTPAQASAAMAEVNDEQRKLDAAAGLPIPGVAPAGAESSSPGPA